MSCPCAKSLIPNPQSPIPNPYWRGRALRRSARPSQLEIEPRAEEEAARVEVAQGLAEGDAARFSALLAEYTKAPEVTLRRIYIETLQDVMPGIRSKIIIDEQTRSILPFLKLDTQTGEQR